MKFGCQCLWNRCIAQKPLRIFSLFSCLTANAFHIWLCNSIIGIIYFYLWENYFVSCAFLLSCRKKCKLDIKIQSQIITT